MGNFIGEGTASGDYSYISFLKYVGGHDSQLTYARGNDPRGIGPNNQSIILMCILHDLHGVMHWDVFGDDNYQIKLGYGFICSVLCKWCRNENY